MRTYQEGFQTEETVQTRPGALPDSQKARQVNALIMKEGLQEELSRIEGGARDDDESSSASDLTDQGEEEERTIDEQLAESVPLYRAAKQQLEEDRRAAVGRKGGLGSTEAPGQTPRGFATESGTRGSLVRA